MESPMLEFELMLSSKDHLNINNFKTNKQTTQQIESINCLFKEAAFI